MGVALGASLMSAVGGEMLSAEGGAYCKKRNTNRAAIQVEWVVETLLLLLSAANVGK